jgi:hypothetical protein
MRYPTEPSPLLAQGLTRLRLAYSHDWRALALAGCGWALLTFGLTGCAFRGSSPVSPIQPPPSSSAMATLQTNVPPLNPPPPVGSSSAAGSRESSARTLNAPLSVPSPITESLTATRVPLEMAGPPPRSPGSDSATAGSDLATEPSTRQTAAQPVDNASDHRRIAGNYQCGQGHTVRVNSAADPRDPNRMDAILLTWQGAQHRLQEVKSVSGAARFENQTAGLLWIMIPGKAMLLSSKIGRPLANDCRL